MVTPMVLVSWKRRSIGRLKSFQIARINKESMGKSEKFINEKENKLKKEHEAMQRRENTGEEKMKWKRQLALA